MLAIIEFPSFVRDADDLFTDSELDRLKVHLAVNPEAGDVIPDTGGVRKMRFGLERKGKGKRGGARVIYYFYDDSVPLGLIAVYDKGQKISLTTAEKNELKKLTKEYVDVFRVRVIKGQRKYKGAAQVNGSWAALPPSRQCPRSAAQVRGRM